MPNRSSKRARDINELAAQVVGEAVGEREPEPEAPATPKDAAAVELGRRGGLKGGKARAAKLSPERRAEIAKRAAEARWAKRSFE